MVLSAARAPARHVPTGRGFYVGFGIFIVLLSFAEFAPSLIDHSRRFAPPMTLHLVHGATALAWLLLYVTQAQLVARGNIAGFFGSLGELIVFSLLVTAGILFRHRPELHKRLMIFTLITLVPEAVLHLSGTLVGRVPLSRSTLFAGMFVVDIAIAFIPAVHDKLTRGLHPASIAIPLLIIAWYVVLNAWLAWTEPAFKLGSWLLQ